MNSELLLKSADIMEKVAEEVASEPCAMGGAPRPDRDVNEGETCRDELARFGYRCQLTQPLVRHADFANVGLDGAKGIVSGFRGRGLRQRIEKRRLADIRQTHDAAFETHGDVLDGKLGKGDQRRRRDCPGVRDA